MLIVIWEDAYKYVMRPNEIHRQLENALILLLHRIFHLNNTLLKLKYAVILL